MDEPLVVYLWEHRVGALTWDDAQQVANFQYDPDFARTGLQVSPLLLPLSANRVFSFPELSRTATFKGLPGLIADSLPEKFGNFLLDAHLAKHGRRIEELTPLERLCYVGRRGMGALEYEPDYEQRNLSKAIPLQVSDLVSVARDMLAHRKQAKANIRTDGIETLIAVGTSAGGAKAKAVIAYNPDTGDVLSGQVDAPEGYSHWLLKFDEVENEELATSKQIGRIEYAYSLMARAAGINMMECQLLEDGDSAHFMTRRFDRVDNNTKVHVVTFAGMAHADRDPPGSVGYERLFQTMRDLGLPQSDLTEMYRRMVFNISSRNQDDHSKNHAFLMFGDGSWQLSPAYDLCFSYKPGNPFIERHQMSCNGKRDNFELSDLLTAARDADVKRPHVIIDEVEQALSRWQEFADAAKLQPIRGKQIGSLFRFFLK